MSHMHSILAATAAHYGLTVEVLKGPGRSQELSHPRQAAMLVARQTTNLSLQQIARALNRDHTTVVYGIRAAQRRAEADAFERAAILEIAVLASETHKQAQAQALARAIKATKRAESGLQRLTMFGGAHG